MDYCPEQKVKITCPSCGHVQVVELELTMGARYMDDFARMFSDKKSCAAYGSFECVCGKKVKSWLVSLA